MALFTFGYEGLSIDRFIGRLIDAHVDTVIDVRELPLSRKRGFSKKAFAAALADSGLGYVHMPALGCPRPVRNRYREDGDWSRYVTGFTGYLDTRADAVAELVTVSRGTTGCLVCFEADYDRCHRSLVGREARRRGAPALMHLTATGVVPDGDRRLAAAA